MAKYATLPEPASSTTPRTNDDAERALRSVSRGLDYAARVLDAPAGTAIEDLLGATDLPTLTGDNPLLELAARLDCEADLWRNLALRELARLEFRAKTNGALVIVFLAADLALAALAGVGALFGSASAWERAGLLATGAVIVTVAAAFTAAQGARARQASEQLVRTALARADLAELRLHRIGIALAYGKTENAQSLEAISRLERDATSG